ncbi:CASP3 [Mytilus coruscus]|uniref:CASP3 n=1 Tax=Mytilus coruscus TaxID=42192 RepID=A0A6J8ACW6_MYTCO|nr:CASP3 [Mytilus coruscus]
MCTETHINEWSDHAPIKLTKISEKTQHVRGSYSCIESTSQIQSTFTKDVYDKKPGQKGLVLIVNFMFSGCRERPGSEVDARNLENFFTKLDYQVESRSDMTKRELQNCFQNIESKYLTEKSKDYHSFICVIMSHGNEKGISTKEKNGTITEHEITEPFKNKEGGKFNGKPKLFLFQSCRGQQKQMKVVVPDSDEQSGSSGIDSNDALVNKVPTDADILVAHATTPNYLSFRNPTNGAYFIQAFLSIAEKKYKVCHVEEMLIDVRRELAKNPEYEIQVGHFAGSCQTSVSQSTYIKKFFL